MSPRKPPISHDAVDAVVTMDDDQTPRPPRRSSRNLIAIPPPAFGPLSLKTRIDDEGFSTGQALKSPLARPLEFTALKPPYADSHYSDDINAATFEIVTRGPKSTDSHSTDNSRQTKSTNDSSKEKRPASPVKGMADLQFAENRIVYRELGHNPPPKDVIDVYKELLDCVYYIGVLPRTLKVSSSSSYGTGMC